MTLDLKTLFVDGCHRLILSSMIPCLLLDSLLTKTIMPGYLLVR